jgi:hypothetical protein
MATPKSKQTPPAPAFQVDVINGLSKGMTHSQKVAALATRSTLAAMTIQKFGGVGGAEELDIIFELQKAGNEVVGGNLGRVERMLVNQAITLDNIFNNLAQRSHKQETLKGIEVLLRLALKAQAQARSTAEALAEIKNPRPIQFVKQSNVTTGPQQVNNAYAGTPSHTGIPTGAGNFQSEQNKLLEQQDGNYLDTRAQGTASRVNPHREAVG